MKPLCLFLPHDTAKCVFCHNHITKLGMKDLRKEKVVSESAEVLPGGEQRGRHHQDVQGRWSLGEGLRLLV